MSAASYTGAGTIQFSGGTRTLDARLEHHRGERDLQRRHDDGQWHLQCVGTTTVNGGTATLAGTLSSLGNALIISSGTLSLNTSMRGGTLTQSGGSLNGTGTLTVTGLSTLSGGTAERVRDDDCVGRGGVQHDGFLRWTAAGRCSWAAASTATGTYVQINLNGANPKPG